MRSSPGISLGTVLAMVVLARRNGQRTHRRSTRRSGQLPPQSQLRLSTGFFFCGWNAIALSEFRVRIEPDSREGAMQPSWIFPIPQTMQQHRGSQVQRTALRKSSEEAAAADSAKPSASTPSRDAATASATEPRKP
jgi:hypothetical protein